MLTIYSWDQNVVGNQYIFRSLGDSTTKTTMTTQSASSIDTNTIATTTTGTSGKFGSACSAIHLFQNKLC